MFVFISWLVSHKVCIHIYFFGMVRNKLYTKNLLEFTKRRPKVHEKNMSRERGLNFGQWKTFSKNYRPMRVWFWLVYKFTKNYCHLQLFSEFIQTQKSYPTSLDNHSLKTTCHIKLNFFFWTKLLENLLFAKYLISVAAT